MVISRLLTMGSVRKRTSRSDQLGVKVITSASASPSPTSSSARES